MENNFTDPKVVGPGLWWYIHSKAKNATTEITIQEFIDLMIYLAEKFPCHTCRKHIKEYIETHPLSELAKLMNEQGERIGMFKWAWLFHNAVNTRINKPYVDWESAIGMFYNDDIEICSKNCHAADGPSEELTVDNPAIDNPTIDDSVDNYENPTLVQSRLVNQSHNKSVNRSVNKSANRSVNKSVNRSDNESRKSKLVQGYFMSVGIPKTLEQQGIIPSLPVNHTHNQITIK